MCVDEAILLEEELWIEYILPEELVKILVLKMKFVQLRIEQIFRLPKKLILILEPKFSAKK
jgi:hypothetical protein